MVPEGTRVSGPLRYHSANFPFAQSVHRTYKELNPSRSEQAVGTSPRN